jgi:phage FluMu protein Com
MSEESKLDLSQVVHCRSCNYFGVLESFAPCYSVYNDIKCPKCGSTNNEHNAQYQRQLNAAMHKEEKMLGRCFKVECSHGDGRPSWHVYRRVIAETSQVAECVRFESRNDGAHVIYLADPIMKSLLEAHTEIKPEEFEQALRNFARAMGLVTQGRK